MPTLTKLYTLQEASSHNTKDDCWVVIDGKIYDVTTYLDEHPGGDDVVLAVTGKDATDEFEDAGHSKTARELMENFFIGELDLTFPAIPELEISHKNQPTEYFKELVELSKQYWAVPVGILSISVGIGFMYLRKKGSN
ncbi:cytochrome b5 [Carica papaya]|uniref:cytochrome b5 n=1 Tax=Carica papaya TaxID=3649 RepID=UPI000B8C97BD|nr:cytochrome b5 [Carica papaya]